MTLKSLPRVASNIYLECANCDRDGSYHRVLAHTSSTSAKTQCEICGKKRTLKLASASPRSAKPRSAARTTTGEKQFQELIEKFGDSITPYSIKGYFTKDTVIDHPKFGRGVVIVSYDDKMQALFRDGLRDLIQNRK